MSDHITAQIMGIEISKMGLRNQTNAGNILYQSKRSDLKGIYIRLIELNTVHSEW